MGMGIEDAIKRVAERARVYGDKHATPMTLLQEVSEYILVLRGELDGPAQLELEQIASAAISLLAQYNE